MVDTLSIASPVENGKLMSPSTGIKYPISIPFGSVSVLPCPAKYIITLSFSFDLVAISSSARLIADNVASLSVRILTFFFGNEKLLISNCFIAFASLTAYLSGGALVYLLIPIISAQLSS